MMWTPAGETAWTVLYEYKLTPEEFSTLDGYSYSFLVEGLRKMYEERAREIRKAKRRARR